MAEPPVKQPVLYTERLILRLADPFNTADCEKNILIYNDPDVAAESVSGIKSVKDIQAKYKRQGPRAEFCTLAPPPRGMFFLMHLRKDNSRDSNEEGDFVGQFHLSFRPEMHCPDFGYAVLAPHQGKGYATEGGKAALDWWRNVVGVKEIFIGTAPYNTASQKVAERLGFVRGGGMSVLLGRPPNEQRHDDGVVFILPGMKWVEGQVMVLTVIAEVEGPELYEPTEQ